MNANSPFLRKVQSFVRRNSRATAGQRNAFEKFWPQYGITFEKKLINFSEIFANTRPIILEIGFGTGQSLLNMAKDHTEKNFIGIETHKPGVGSLLNGIDAYQLKNLRVFYADAVEVLTFAIPDASLDGIQIFFPDPWPKRRHHKRRLIQPDFVNLLVKKLKPHGILHLATDWEDYAMHMMDVLSNNSSLENLAGIRMFANRSAHRPVVTKFEQRGIKAGRAIWELQFQKPSAGTL